MSRNEPLVCQSGSETVSVVNQKCKKKKKRCSGKNIFSATVRTYLNSEAI